MVPSGVRSTPKLLSSALLAVALASGCSAIKYDTPPPRSEAFAFPEDSKIARILEVESRASTGRSGFHLLSYGMEALVARLATADKAEHTIDAQYYLYDTDRAGAILTQHLIAAADRGVRVRLLVDDIDTKSDKELAALAAHPHIEVRLFNPLRGRSLIPRLPEYLFDLHNSDRRMHNKLFIADSEASILGGRNVGDDYFDLSQDNAFRDFDLLSIGPVSQQAEAAFDQFWNSRWSIPIAEVVRRRPTPQDFQWLRAEIDSKIQSGKAFENAYEEGGTKYLADLKKDPNGLVWGFGRVVSEPPRKIAEELPQDDMVSNRLQLEWKRANKEVVIECSYFLPGEQVLEAFRSLHSRGVPVTVVTCGLEATDVPLVYATYRRSRPAILETGVDLYEFKLHPPKVRGPGKWYHEGASYSAMHSKVIEFDQQRVWVGSFNLDPRSTKLNTEVAIIAECPALAKQLATAIKTDLAPARSWKVMYGESPAGNGSRAMLWVGGIDGKSAVLTHDPGSLRSRVSVFLWSLVPGLGDKL